MGPPAVPVERLIADIAARLGHVLPAEWARALRAVPRHLFLPDRVWPRDGEGGYAVCDRAAEPERWWAAAYGDEPVVTRLSDGVPESSAPAPSTVVRMLEAAQPTDGMRALEIGTGTGFHAGLLCHRLGDEHVATVQLDPLLADQARANLKRAGYTPHVVCGDGALGWSDGAPYDLLVATARCGHCRRPGSNRCGQAVGSWRRGAAPGARTAP